MPEERVRSFIAFDVDNENVLRRLADVQRELTDTGADLELVKPQNVHVTLRFLGEISSTMMDRVYEEMSGVKIKPFDIELRGMGAFPNLRRPRVVWIGIKKGASELIDIFDQLEPRLNGLGFTPEKRGFSPHITVARVRTGKCKEELAQRIVERSDYDFGVVKANSLKLKKSVLTPKGPVYSVLREVKP